MNRQFVETRLASLMPDDWRSETARFVVPGGEPKPGSGTLLRRAAVLVPLIDRPDGLQVLLTLRTITLRAHAGQVAFPGGSVDVGDPDAVATALRETQEELGLPPELVHVVGRLEVCETRTGFTILPIVGFVDAPYSVTPNPEEVGEVFEIPLDDAIDISRYELQLREGDNRKRSGYALVHEGRRISGATAGILVNLAELLGEP